MRTYAHTCTYTHTGDCLNVGCVPSKALLRCANAIRESRRLLEGEFGGRRSDSNSSSSTNIKGTERGSKVAEEKRTYGVEFSRVMERMREKRARIAPADAYSTSAGVGVDCYQGEGGMLERACVHVLRTLSIHQQCTNSTPKQHQNES